MQALTFWKKLGLGYSCLAFINSPSFQIYPLFVTRCLHIIEVSQYKEILLLYKSMQNQRSSHCFKSSLNLIFVKTSLETNIHPPPQETTFKSLFDAISSGESPIISGNSLSEGITLYTLGR